MVRGFAWVAALALALGGTGCSYSASFVSDLPRSELERLRAGRAHRPPEEIEVFMKGRKPERRYVTLGHMHAPEIQWSAMYGPDDLIEALRERASEEGADALIVTGESRDATSAEVGGSTVPMANYFMYATAILYE